MNLLFGSAPLWPHLAMLALWCLYWLACMQIHSRQPAPALVREA